MSDALLSTLLSYGIPVVQAIVVSIFAVIGLGLFMAGAAAWAWIFFVVLLTFINAGSEGYLVPPEFSVYTKGAGTLFFPLIQYYLYGLFLATFFQNAFAGRTVLKGAGKEWMLAFGVLFGCHVAYGLAIGVSSELLFARIGIINVLHMSMVAYIAVSVIRDEKALAIFAKTFLVVALASGGYGLVRFVLFGGDPQNGYANDDEGGGFNLKVSYWDFNEGLIATVAAFYCGWRLVREWSTLSFLARIFFLSAVAVEVLVVLLSYRRQQHYGLVLAALYFICLLPKGKRGVGFLVLTVLMSAALLQLNSQRAEQFLRRSNLTIMERLAPDVAARGGVSGKKSRFYELYVALDTVERSPLVGVGTWGEFDVGLSSNDLSYHKGEYGFVHSGLGHVLLKSGLIGLAIFCAILFAACRCASRGKSRVRPQDLALFEACRAGLLFMVPSLLVAPMIPNFRAMTLFGLMLALPIAIPLVARSSSAQPVARASRPAMMPAMRPSMSS